LIVSRGAGVVKARVRFDATNSATPKHAQANRQRQINSPEGYIFPCITAIPREAKQRAWLSIGLKELIDRKTSVRRIVAGSRPGSCRQAFDESRTFAKKQNIRLRKRPVSVTSRYDALRFARRDQLTKGLPPPSRCPCRAHQKEAPTEVGASPLVLAIWRRQMILRGRKRGMYEDRSDHYPAPFRNYLSRPKCESGPLQYSKRAPANRLLCYATCCSHITSHPEQSESQTHASLANHSCVARHSGQ
jgi:hypothetical protein